MIQPDISPEDLRKAYRKVERFVDNSYINVLIESLIAIVFGPPGQKRKRQGPGSDCIRRYIINYHCVGVAVGMSIHCPLHCVSFLSSAILYNHAYYTCRLLIN